MILQHSTWPEVESYLQRSTGIIIPIGSTEQHGPNGLIGTDAICPEIIACGIAERVEVMVGPTLNVGMAQHHMGFPGTISLRPSTLQAVVMDVVASLTQHGFTHLYFLNGHGGNTETVGTAFSEIYAENSLGKSNRQMLCKIKNWWTTGGIRELSRELFNDAEGFHATPSEVSLTFFACPESIKQADMSPLIAPSGSFRDAADFRRKFPDGRIGSNPALASVEAGEKLYQAAVADLTEDYQAFIQSV